MTFDATYADYVPNSMPDGWGITFEPLDSDDRRNFILAPTGRGDMRGEIFRRLGVKIPTDYSTAHCAYHPDPDLWFDYRRQAQALAICEGCPMRTTCIEEATSAHCPPRSEDQQHAHLTQTPQQTRSAA